MKAIYIISEKLKHNRFWIYITKRDIIIELFKLRLEFGITNGKKRFIYINRNKIRDHVPTTEEINRIMKEVYKRK